MTLTEAVAVDSMVSCQTKKVIEIRRKSLTRKVRRKKAKAIAERRFLSCKVSKKVNSVCDQYPDIGSRICTQL